MSYDPERVTFFAKTDARGQQLRFGIKAKDRTRHMYVIGKTGMGKSTLLENMAVQDIQNGEGLAFIDPHGQTAETLLDYIPEHRVKDVLYFAPFDTEYPVAFNVMEDVGPEKRHLVVSGLMSVFKKIWIDAWSARMEYILQNTLLALLEYPDSTLLGVNRMLSDKVYRKKVIDNITDPAVKSFWVDEFLNYNERYMQEAGDAIKNKIGQFTANPLIRNIIGQPKSSFDIRTIMDEKKILIMNLSKGLVGESNANLLGSMLTTRIYLAAMSRADLPLAELQQKPNFYFYVDEFQSFANATFADILSEARKYKLNLTIAHQYIEQMEEEVRNAVFGNVGTIVSFRVGPFDAETLETIFAPQFLAVDICNLGFAQVYLSLMIDGIGSKPFSAVTLPPIEMNSVSCKEMVVHTSRQQFANGRAPVEATINAWHATEVGSSAARQASGSSKPSGAERKDDSRGHAGKSAEKRNTDTTPKPKPKQSESNVNTDTRKQESERPRKSASSETNLDDLRSVLRNLAQTEEKESKRDVAAQPAKKTEPRKSEHTDTKQVSDTEGKKDNNSDTAKSESIKSAPEKPDLKSALRDVLAAAQTKTDPKSQEKVEAQATEEDKQSEVASTTPPPAAKQPDPLDPKKLERMMRVTTSDKSPLK